MIHIFQESKRSKRILVLLHGFGGDEYDLIPLAQQIDPDASILSLRGNVIENGALRFFKRIGPNVFDQDSIRHEAKVISTFLHDFADIHQRPLSDYTFMGFSNGANMIVALAHFYPALASKALILHGLLPLENAPKTDLSGCKMFVSLGSKDTMILPAQTQSLISELRARTADVTVYKDDGGHSITASEIAAAQQFLKL